MNVCRPPMYVCRPTYVGMFACMHARIRSMRARLHVIICLSFQIKPPMPLV